MAGLPDQEFNYDVFGNLNDQSNELDMVTLITNNAIGFPTLVRTPYGTTGPLWLPRDATTTTYSDRNEVLSTVRSAGSRSQTSLTTYDAEGNPETITRTWSPNPQAISPQVTTIVYDAVDRAVRKTESSGGTDSTVYDVAGNAIQAITRRGQVISSTYDLLNRMLSRAIPVDNSYLYPAPSPAVVQGGALMEFAPYTYARPAETQAFAYDTTGQVRLATALDADVARTYHPSGALLTDTLRIANRARTEKPHAFWLSYSYDRNGRRTARTLGPSSVFPGVPMTYGYFPWGALSTIGGLIPVTVHSSHQNGDGGDRVP